VISVWDADSIYKIPWMLHQQMLDENRLPQARHPSPSPPTSGVEEIGRGAGESSARDHHRHGPASMSTLPTPTNRSTSPWARGHPRAQQGDYPYVDAESIRIDGLGAQLKGRGRGARNLAVSASRGVEGMMKAIQYARENRVPYLGICLACSSL